MQVLRSERGHITKSKAKNVFVLDSKNKSALFSHVGSKWLAENVLHSGNEAGKSEFWFSRKIFKAIDEAVLTHNSADSMKIAGDLSQSHELSSLE